MRNFFKALLLPALSFITCVGLVSCSNDDEPEVDTTPGVVNPSNVFTGKLPLSVGGTAITRNAAGFVTEMKTNDGTTVKFKYPETRVPESNEVVMTVDDDGDVTDYILTIGSKGFVTMAHYEHGVPGDKEYEKGDWTIYYDNDGHLVKLHDEYVDYYGREDYTVNLKWKDGNLIETYKDGGWDKYTYQYTSTSYPAAIENKGSLFMFESIYPIEIYQLEWIYYAGMLGQGPKNLAVSSKEIDDEDDSWTEEYVWTLNSNGYPMMFDVKNDDHPGMSTVAFSWN